MYLPTILDCSIQSVRRNLQQAERCSKIAKKLQEVQQCLQNDIYHLSATELMTAKQGQVDMPPNIVLGQSNKKIRCIENHEELYHENVA
jgi:hypothetical protein